MKSSITLDNVKDIGVQKTDETVYVYAYEGENSVCLELTEESAKDLLDQLRTTIASEPSYTSGAHSVNRGAW